MNVNQSIPAKKNNSISILKAMLFLSNLAALTLYFFLRIIFTGFTISLKEDLTDILQILATATALGLGLYFLYLFRQFAGHLWKKRRLVLQQNTQALSATNGKKDFESYLLPA